MSDDKKEVKQSNLVFDIIIIIIGAVAVFLGVTSYLFYGVVSLGLGGVITVPSWWPFDGPATLNFVTTLGGGVMVPLGVWVLISGFGLVREKAWAIGALFVCFTLILFTAGVGLVQNLWFAFINHGLTAYALIWANWVVIILVAVAFIGFIYLLATHKRYH